MRFKNWLDLDESRFKGFQRHFNNNHREVPAYVRNQIYYNRLTPDMRKATSDTSVGNDGETIAYTPNSQANSSLSAGNNGLTIDYTPSVSQRSSPVKVSMSNGEPKPSPRDMMAEKDYLYNVNWMQKPVIVNVTPLNFDERTLRLFIKWRFGYAPNDDDVRNDTKRFDVQREKLNNQTSGENEPIVMIRDGDKYRLLEGYHRTMLMLLSPHDVNQGAPYDQQQALMAGRMNEIDFTTWRPVKIRSYVGVRKTFELSSLQDRKAAMKMV